MTESTIEDYSEMIMHGRCPICLNLMRSIPMYPVYTQEPVSLRDSAVQGGFFLDVLCEMLAHLAAHTQELSGKGMQNDD